MNASWSRVHGQLALMMLGCLSLSLVEVARPLGAWLPTLRRSPFDAGGVFPELVGRDESGVVRIHVPADGELRLVFVVSPFCPICEDTLPSVRRILAEVFPPGVRALPVDVLLVCLSPLDLAREYVSRQGLTGRLLAVNRNRPSGDAELATAGHFEFTPQAFLVGGAGQVMLADKGLSPADAEEWVARIWRELEAD